MNRVPLLAALALSLSAQAVPGGPGDGAPQRDAPVRLRVHEQKPSLLGGVGRAAARTLRRLWEREEPAAVRGNALVVQNDVPGALQAYEEAGHGLPKGGEAEASLALNRSGALLRLGADEAVHALEQAGRALASANPATREQGAYDAALALESAGKTDEAIAAYGRTLDLDPEDVDAKVNLELLLKEEERKKKAPGQGPQDQEKPQQQKGDSPQDAQAKGDAPGKEPQKSPGEPGKSAPKPQGEKGPRDQPSPPPERDQAGNDPRERPEPRGGQSGPDKPASREPPPGQSDPGEQARAGGAQPLDRSEAQRLLDALRAGEKNLQAWRFGKRTQDARRRQAEKDW